MEETAQATPATTTASEPPAAQPPTPGLRDVLKNRNFRLLWLGETISVLGDQFHLIALPWLVLKLTGDALAMGTVLAIAGIPRAIFMLVGGALTDRFSARSIMLASNFIRLVLVGLLAFLTFTGAIQLWMLYLFALSFGLADAFFFPAQSSIVPKLVQPDQLAPANTVIQGTAQLSVFVGPALAGTMIALLSGGAVTSDAPPELSGIAIAFALDALTFGVSALTLRLIHAPRVQIEGAASDGSVKSANIARVRYAWNDATLRTYMLIVAAINLLVTGPIGVGIPVLADRRFPEGAAAFGLLLSAFGGGALLGMVLAGSLPKPPLKRMGTRLLVIISLMGIGLASLGLINSTAIAAVAMLAMGVANGYVNILFITWLQQRTPDTMLGRVMSLLMFASLGLSPLSNALAGALIEWNATALFIGAGIALTLVCLLASLNPQTRNMDSAPA